MDDPASQPYSDTSFEPSPASQQESIRSLRSLLVAVIFATLVLTGSFFVFLLREVTLVRRQITEQAQYIGEFDKSMDDLRFKFQAFARTNPDFNPIMTKYFGTNMAPAIAPAPKK